MNEWVSSIFGLGLPSEALTISHLAARAFFIYFAGMILLRIQS